jgi:uncharacterized protein (DUF1501 family)
MSKQLNASRRLFLQQAGALSTLGVTAAPLALNLAAMGSAAAQTASGYKAIVCLFMFGGNDSLNMVLPTDTASWTNYSTVRNQAPESIALLAPGTAPNPAATAGSPEHLGGVLPIVPLRPQGRTFALHPSMAAAQALFQGDGTSRRLAIVPNVGPLVMPTTKAQLATATHPRPPNLYSHNDQQNYWQSFRTEGATQGWGGRMGDILAAGNGRSVFTAISTSGNTVWLSGQSVRQYQVGTSGAIRMGVTDMSGRIYGSTAVGNAMAQVVRNGRGGHVYEGDIAAINARSIDAEVALRTALTGLGPENPLFGTAPASGTSYNANNDPKLRYTHPVTGAGTFNPLAQQLQTVARLVQAAPGVEAHRQVFFVSIGGFDTHDAQNRNHADLMARVAHALAYFDSTLGAMGKRNDVTLFTASDFGRTFTSNGDGTDHGWGAHHFVMGGAVRGGDLYGNFPVLGAKNANNNNFDSSPDQVGNGALLPATSVDQLGATLATWFGLSASQCLDIFPNLANFSTRDLGFMS